MVFFLAKIIVFTILLYYITIFLLHGEKTSHNRKPHNFKLFMILHFNTSFWIQTSFRIRKSCSIPCILRSDRLCAYVETFQWVHSINSCNSTTITFRLKENRKWIFYILHCFLIYAARMRRKKNFLLLSLHGTP